MKFGNKDRLALLEDTAAKLSFYRTLANNEKGVDAIVQALVRWSDSYANYLKYKETAMGDSAKKVAEDAGDSLRALL